MDALTTVVTTIINGEVDKDLDAIIDAIKNRRKAISVTQLLTLKEGTRVKVINLRPSYLVGLEGEIVGRRNSRLSMKLDRPELATRFAVNGVIQVPAGCVQPI